MNCYKKEITKNWLYQEDKYIENIVGAFEVIKLHEERSVQAGNARQKITEQLQKYIDEDPEDLPQHLSTQHVLSLDEQLLDYPCYKKGGIFGSVTQRQCQLQKTTLGQSKKGNVIIKTFGVIKTFYIQHLEDANKDFKWDVSYQKFPVRIMFNFVKHSPVWLYFKDDEEAQKYYDYFKCHIAMNKIQKLPIIIQESTSLVKENYFLLFAQKLETYSIHVIQQRKKAAKLGKDEAKFLMEIDVKIIRNILQKKWLSKSVQFFKREERMNQLAEEERKKLDQIRQEDENKKMKWRQFLGSKSVLNVELAEWLRPMMADWLEKSEEIQNTQKVRELVFTILIKSINIAVDINLIKPTLFVELQSVEQDSKLTMEAYLGQQKTDHFYNWLLREQNFENKIISKQQERKPCSFIISNINNQDQFQIQFKDMVNAFYDTATIPFKIIVKELLQQSQQGRSMWIPLKLVQTNSLKTESKESIIYVEIDIHVKPSIMMHNPQSYEEELEYIVEHSLAFSDPIYLSTIQIPKMNKDIMKFILITLEESNICMKQSMQMLSYILFLQQKNPETLNKQMHQLQMVFIRKVILNLCHNFGLMEKQIKQYELVSYRLESMNFYNIKNPQVQELVNGLFLMGIPYYLRNKLWFQLLQISFDPIKQVLSQNYKVNLDREDGMNESVSLYFKLSQLKQNLKKTLLQQIDIYLRQEDSRKGFGNEQFYHQLKNLLICFLLYQGNQGLIPNQIYIHHLFTFAKKMLVMQIYYNVRYNDYTEFANETKQTPSDLINESRAFWLLVGFHNQVLADYPLYEDQTLQNRLFLEQCAKLRVYLNKKHPDLFHKMFLYGIEVENELFELFFNLFSDVLPSETLYRAWDLIIYQQQQSIRATSERGNIIISITAALLLRVHKKINNISNHLAFLAAIKVEAMLINDVTEFLTEVLQVQKDLNLAVQIEYQEEGPPKLEPQVEYKIKSDYRIFDVLDEKHPKGSQQMQVYQYLNFIDF
ncbi:unnamed protein product [Paramecium primaurelia]|uniref:Rab-GAP TBC domain-containing protein n=1 Tax=Paramecium primaurelia TaxID=5886 RepID=A0A8S1M5I6_PARPR|nr:unnamed protein product [Paramecium primaurelia]